MRVLQVCAEIFPLLKTGGLADVAAALPPALVAEGADVRVLLPGFPVFLKALQDAGTVAELTLPFPSLGGGRVRLVHGFLPEGGVHAFLVDAPGLYDRPGGPYADERKVPYADNHLRFATLGWMAGQMAAGVDSYWRPDVVHAHDWHAGLAPAYVRAESVRAGHRLAASVFTVHNLAYQGLFGAEVFHDLALPAEYWGVHGVEFHGHVNFMKSGLYFADRITTVSPTYAQEIQGWEQGCGLQGLLHDRRHQLDGILNGVDDAVWNPSLDPLIPHPYKVRQLVGKTRCKSGLVDELGLSGDASGPLFCAVSRLTEQKGLHLMLEALPWLLEQGAQFALLGSGDAWMEEAFRQVAAQHPTQVAVHIGYDEDFAHRLIAGSDAIVVPSRYEPCGLTQLYGLKYATLPVVRRVGGLADSVHDTRLETLDTDATGFVFDTFDVSGLQSALMRALALYRRRADWTLVQRRAMQQPFGWSQAAQRYLQAYRAAWA